MCIYDNHQWFVSSWIGYGIGIPNSIMSRYFSQVDANTQTKYDDLVRFWKCKRYGKES